MSYQVFARKYRPQTFDEVLGQDAVVLLFGSRVDDLRRGGDIDLLLRVPEDLRTVENKLRFLVRLQLLMGVRRIDAVYEEPQNDFVHAVRPEAIVL